MEIEKQLFAKKYWIQGEEVIITTAKWGKMMRTLFKEYPQQIITLEMIRNYIHEA